MKGFVFDEHCEFHAVLILFISCLFVVFCVFFCSVMALRFSCDGELSKTLCTSRAADPNNAPSEMCDQILIR